MKSLVKRSSAAALAGLLLCLAFVPAAHAVEILRWERLPLAVPLVAVNLFIPPAFSDT